MKVYVTRNEISIEEKKIYHKVNAIDFCCDTMKKTKIMGVAYVNTADYEQQNLRVAIMLNNYDYETETSITEYYPIEHCPFCGARIDVKTVEVADITKEHQELEAEYDKLTRRFHASDSFPERLELLTLRSKVAIKQMQLRGEMPCVWG